MLKTKFSELFNWFSTHWGISLSITSTITFFYLTFINPLLLKWVYVPVWLILIIAVTPIVIWRLYIYFFVLKRRFKGGEPVVYVFGNLKLTVLNYNWFSKNIVNCKDHQNKTYTFHQNSLFFYGDTLPKSTSE